MFPSCPDNISPGSTYIGANYPNTEFDIPPEDGGWFDGGALPPSGPYPSAGGIPLIQGSLNPGPQQPLVGPLVPLVVLPGPPVGPTGAAQPSIQPPAHGRRQLDLENDQFGCLSQQGFTSPMGSVPAWQQQLCDTLHNMGRYQPAQQASPPLALEEQDLSGSMQPRQSSRVRQPASTHPDNVYGSLDPVSHLQMDLQCGMANLQAGNPAQALQEEDPVALEPLPEVPDEDDGLEYLTAIK